MIDYVIKEREKEDPQKSKIGDGSNVIKRGGVRWEREKAGDNARRKVNEGNRILEGPGGGMHFISWSAESLRASGTRGGEKKGPKEGAPTKEQHRDNRRGGQGN